MESLCRVALSALAGIGFLLVNKDTLWQIQPVDSLNIVLFFTRRLAPVNINAGGAKSWSCGAVTFGRKCSVRIIWITTH